MKREVLFRLRCCRNFISMLWSKLLIFWNHKYSKNPIPEGPYCYFPDDEKNQKEPHSGYWIKPCKYYKVLSNRWRGCKFLGTITDDYIFRDQCKMCNEKFDE